MLALRFLLAIFAGLLIGVLLRLAGSWYLALTLPGPDQTIPTIFDLLHGPIIVLQQIAPGFIAGFLARRSAWVVGSTAGLLMWFVDLLVFAAVPIAMFSNALNISSGLGAVIMGAVAGAAGLFAAYARTPPNNSFKPKPLRGSA